MSTENNNVWMLSTTMLPETGKKRSFDIESYSEKSFLTDWEKGSSVRWDGYEWDVFGLDDNRTLQSAQVLRWRPAAGQSYTKAELSTIVAKQQLEFSSWKQLIDNRFERTLKVLDSLEKLTARYREELDEAFRRTNDLQTRLIALEKGRSPKQ